MQENNNRKLSVALVCVAMLSLTACDSGTATSSPEVSPQGTTISQPVKAGVPEGTRSATQQEQAQATAARQDASYIGMDKAKELALADASLTADQVTVIEQKQDTDDGVAEYDIDFIYENTEYEYEIDAATGSIRGKSQQPIAMDAGETQEGHIGIDAAKQVALTHSGLAEGDVVITKLKLDYDDGRYEYKVEFIYNNSEYEYEIDAMDGTILDFEMETSKAGVTA